ncbi:MAG: MFS transporter [Burkholderiales bacterium]|nr:MFS transporter [Burkholderiales bacterium]
MRKLLKEKVTVDFIKTSFGNILEWYDFAIYGLFAVQISSNFFPSNSKFLSLLMVFLTFAVGFVARPFGSIIFGQIGDKLGKHYAVNLSIWCMAIPTSIIGFLPSYHVIGIFAPILLVLLRICQGISAGGQFSGLITIAVDSKSSNKQFLVSLIYAISVVGGFCASFIGLITVTVVNHFSDGADFITSLSWRIPFILSGVFFLIYLKLKPDFSKHGEASANSFKLITIFKQQPHEMISVSLLSATTNTIYYILFTYLITYLQIHLQFSKSEAFTVMNIILFISIFMYIFFGYYAGKSNYRLKIAQVTSLIIGLGTLLLPFSPLHFWVGMIGLLVMVTAFCATIAYTTSLFAEIFDKKYRMTACSVGFSIGVTISGFSPLMAEILSRISIFGLPCFIVFICFIMLFSLRMIKQTDGYKLANV